MGLRPELEPNIEKAEELFPKVMELLARFDEGFDQGDARKMEAALQQLRALTKKEVEKDDLYEYWGYINVEDLAFKLALPLPRKIDGISEQEVSEINERIRSLEKADKRTNTDISNYLFDAGVLLSCMLIEEYYNPLLDINDPGPPTHIIYL